MCCNEEKGNLLYSAYGSSGQCGLFDKQFGRLDSQKADPEGRLPEWDIPIVQEMKDIFTAIGFGPRQCGLLDKQFGRLDTQEADSEGRLPEWDIPIVQEMKHIFTAIGFGPRQLGTLVISEHEGGSLKKAAANAASCHPCISHVAFILLVSGSGSKAIA